MRQIERTGINPYNLNTLREVIHDYKASSRRGVNVFYRALIVREPYATLIATGQKTLEMRSRHTNVRGRIGIIPAGSGEIICSVELVNSWGYTGESGLKGIGGQTLHCVEPEDWHLLDKWCFGWELRNPNVFDNPIKYKHPKGAVVWVKTKEIEV